MLGNGDVAGLCLVTLDTQDAGELAIGLRVETPQLRFGGRFADGAAGLVGCAVRVLRRSLASATQRRQVGVVGIAQHPIEETVSQRIAVRGGPAPAADRYPDRLAKPYVQLPLWGSVAASLIPGSVVGKHDTSVCQAVQGNGAGNILPYRPAPCLRVGQIKRRDAHSTEVDAGRTLEVDTLAFQAGTDPGVRQFERRVICRPFDVRRSFAGCREPRHQVPAPGEGSHHARAGGPDGAQPASGPDGMSPP